MHKRYSSEPVFAEGNGLECSRAASNRPITDASGENEVGSKYCRLFRQSEEPPTDVRSLEALGAAMATEDTLTRARDDSRIPAGYTYLGHLLAHDLTFDTTQGLPVDALDVENLENARSPFVDLESIYGSGPEGAHHAL
jgi:hypothetical protein